MIEEKIKELILAIEQEIEKKKNTLNPIFRYLAEEAWSIFQANEVSRLKDLESLLQVLKESPLNPNQ